jgi:NitT/TauT family transport system permease protein
MSHAPWLAIRKEPPARRSAILTVLSFVLPLAIWCLVSYVPFIWHPLVEVTDSGDSIYLEKGGLVDRASFEQENARIAAENGRQARGVRANPVYLPAPHEVARAMYTAFTTEPRRPEEPWLHESLWHSIRVVFLAFWISSIIGVPLGILCGVFGLISKLFEPFIEFFRYLPAPVFGALAVAVLGIGDGPKIAIIFIGTFFQQVLVIANTTRKVEPALIEAAQTLGARGATLVRRVVLPAISPHIYRDMRILLGWAWTYLIVAEVVGASTGITWFINQQAKYRIYENVYAAILIIGVIGFGTDYLLGVIEKNLFVWNGGRRNRFFRFIMDPAPPIRARAAASPGRSAMAREPSEG